MIRILLVSAHPAIRHGLAHVIGREPGFLVEVSGSAETAIDGLWKVRPDLVLIDAPLGSESGFELCHRLKQLARPQRVVVYVSQITEETTIAASVAGADALREKSEATDDLLDALRIVVRGPRTLQRPSHAAIGWAAADLEPPESSIFAMCLHRVPLDEISRTLRLDPLAVEAAVHSMLDRFAGTTPPATRSFSLRGEP